MSLTLVVMERSKELSMRFSISSGEGRYSSDDADHRDIDVGKISTGMPMLAAAARMAISMARTTKV
jgi:hypothetical protein